LHPRTTAVAGLSFLGMFGERPFPKWTGHSTEKTPRTPLGQESPFAPRES
jgi:hypothetical protein